MTWLLLKLLPGALRYTDGGERQFILHAAIALVLDVIVAHTTFAVIPGVSQVYAVEAQAAVLRGQL